MKKLWNKIENMLGINFFVFFVYFDQFCEDFIIYLQKMSDGLISSNKEEVDVKAEVVAEPNSPHDEKNHHENENSGLNLFVLIKQNTIKN